LCSNTIIPPRKMKEKLALLLLVSAFTTQAQTNSTDMKYRRSSLYTMMVEDATRERADVIKKSFMDFQLSDKFNNHNLDNRTMVAKANAKDQDANIDSFLIAKGVARDIVAKWFDRSAKGTFDMKLIAERGSYNATEMDASIAKKSKKGLAMLADAGEELIGNTFILVSDYKYVNKEEVAKKTKRGLGALGSIAAVVPGAGNVTTATNVASTAATVAGKGYVVKTTSYLYQLRWNDSIASVFYNEMWMDEGSFDEKKKALFDKTKMFSLNYIGSDVAWADVQSTVFTKKSDDELIIMATNRALDAVIAKLQRNHEEFRTKTPLFSTDPLAAKIGLKEGLESGDKYIVLEQRMDEEGRTTYEKIGMIKVDGSQIWDNRYMATGDSTGQTVDRTLFNKVSGKDFYPGLLIKQK
jgi:hypothetical protein